MQSRIKWIRSLDIVSSEAKLTFNKNGDTRHSTLFGGILSILGSLTCFSLAIFFLWNFLSKKGTSVITSLETSNFINITDSHETPFLFRLTDKNNKPYEHPEKMYKISLKFWYGGSNSSLENTGQETQDIPVERCIISKHFGKYQNLFLNLADIQTFYCANLRSYNQTIYGSYGNVYPFGYYHFYISMCIDNNTCDDREYLEKEFSNTYLDFRTVDYTVDSHSKKNKHAYIKSERFMISMTVYKRIWFYIKGIKYVKDEGFWLEKKHSDYFFQFDSLRYDIDHRDIFTGTIPGTFLTLTFVTTGNILVYYQTFTKIQELIGTLSGVVKLVMVITSILNYPHSQSSYYLKLMNDFLSFDTKCLKNTEYSLGYTLSNNFSKLYPNTFISSFSNINLSAFSNLNFKNQSSTIYSQKCFNSPRNANTKVNVGNLQKKKILTFITPISKIKENILINNRTIKSKDEKNKSFGKKIKFGIWASLLPMKYFFKKQKNGEALKLYFYILNEKLNVIRILLELEKITMLDEWLKINHSFSNENIVNQLNQIPIVKKHQNQKIIHNNNKM